MRLLKNGKKYQDRKLEIEYVPTNSINPNTYNPNVHTAKSFDMLIKSIMFFGLTQPIVVRKETSEIIDGENRWRAANVLGFDEVPVCFLSLTDEEMIVATIIHNRARGKEISSQIEKLDSQLMEKAPAVAKEILLYER